MPSRAQRGSGERQKGSDERIDRGKGRGPEAGARAQIDRKAVLVSVSQAVSQPRLAFYSPVAAAVLNYLKNTQPRFSISSELAKLVEAELAKRYPILFSHVKRALEAKGVRRRARAGGVG